MDNILQILNNGTQLDSRFLSFDGDSILDPDKILELILDGSSVDNMCTTEITSDIEMYNNTSLHKINIKTKLRDFDFSYNIPKYYKKINVLQYVINKHVDIFGDICKPRYNRILHEMSKFKKYELFDFLRTLIYIQETFDKNGIVKGVGRGSSVASYVLYIIGIHIIDSYKYNLDFSEFIREEDFNNAQNS